MEVDRLKAQDAALWCAQATDAPLQIGALCLIEGTPLRDSAGELRIDDLRHHLELLLPMVPRFRQKLYRLPLGMGLAWTDDADFDMGHHLLVTRLPAPGDDEALRALASNIIEEPLDPGRPLWEIWVVDGLTDDRVAVLAKVSHVMADGMALLEFAFSLLDLEPEPHEPGPGDEARETWSPEPARVTIPMLLPMAADRARRQVGALWDITSRLADPRTLTSHARTVANLGSGGGSRAPALAINRPVGPHRDFAWVRLPWDRLNRVKRAEGVKLNDVVLAITAGAVGEYLEKSGEQLGDRSPRVLVPASTHGDHPGEEMENRFSIMVTELPVASHDPLERVRQLHDAMQREKDSSEAAIAPVLFSLTDLLPQALLRIAGPLALRHQPFVNLAVTNLPGTRDPLYLLGARLLELYPYVGVTGNIAIIIGVLSYQDSIHLGITVDSDVVGDLDVLADAVRNACEELIEAAEHRPGAQGVRVGGAET